MYWVALMCWCMKCVCVPVYMGPNWIRLMALIVGIECDWRQSTSYSYTLLDSKHTHTHIHIFKQYLILLEIQLSKRLIQYLSTSIWILVVWSAVCLRSFRLALLRAFTLYIWLWCAGCVLYASCIRMFRHGRLCLLNISRLFDRWEREKAYTGKEYYCSIYTYIRLGTTTVQRNDENRDRRKKHKRFKSYTHYG